jgi:hypothetical protein
MKTILAAAATAALVSAGAAVLFAPAPSPPAQESFFDERALEDLRDSLEGVRKDLADIGSRLALLETTPRAEVSSAAPSPALPRCEPHCESIREAIDLLERKLVQLESTISRRATDGWVLSDATSKRPWGPEQATGEPDTPLAGDHPTAWASKTPDDQDEWLLLEFPKAVRASGLRVHETFNPGALSQVSVFDSKGNEHFVWGGADPAPPGSEMGVSWVPFQTRFQTRKVKLHFHSPGVPGWNEIDAVALVDTAGKSQWASTASASSTYASDNVPGFTFQVFSGRPFSGGQR